MSAFTGRSHVTYSILDMIIFVYKVCFSFLFCSNIACQCNSCTRFFSAERIFVNTKWSYVCRMEENAFDRMATIQTVAVFCICPKRSCFFIDRNAHNSRINGVHLNTQTYVCEKNSLYCCPALTFKINYALVLLKTFSQPNLIAMNIYTQSASDPTCRSDW